MATDFPDVPRVFQIVTHNSKTVCSLKKKIAVAQSTTVLYNATQRSIGQTITPTSYTNSKVSVHATLGATFLACRNTPAYLFSEEFGGHRAMLGDRDSMARGAQYARTPESMPR